MNKHIGVVCGSFHKEEVSRMLEFAKDEAEQHGFDHRQCGVGFGFNGGATRS